MTEPGLEASSQLGIADLGCRKSRSPRIADWDVGNPEDHAFDIIRKSMALKRASASAVC